jgi:hypothetical protein
MDGMPAVFVLGWYYLVALTRRFPKSSANSREDRQRFFCPSLKKCEDMQVKNWRFRKLILFWMIALVQVCIVLSILTKPFPIKPESNGFFVIVTTVMMIAESALITSVAMLVITWKWLHARIKDETRRSS